MRPFLQLVVICILVNNLSIARNRQYSIAEATNGISGTLAPKSVKQASWRPGTHEFYQTVKVQDRDYYIRTTYPSGKVDTIMDMAHLRVSGYFGENKKPLPAFQWIDPNIYAFENDSNLLTVTVDKDGKAQLFTQAHTLPKGYANLSFSPNGGLAYTLQNNLYYSERMPGNFQDDIAITKDSDPNIVNGQAVHRNEFGIDKGIFFSPKGNLLAYYRMDQSMVADYPVIDWSVTPAKNENVKYPMAGGVSHQVSLQVFNIRTGKTTMIRTSGPKDQYLTCITWSPDEKYIYIGILNRDQNHLWMNQYDANSGEFVKTILQEKDEKYVEPQHPLSFLPGSNTKFIWWSQRDGYMHLWLCDISSNTMNCLTPGKYVVNDLLGFRGKSKELLFCSGKEDPREKHGYAVNWETGKMRRLDKVAGTHNYTVTEDGDFAFDVLTGKGIPKRSAVLSTDGAYHQLLLDAPNPLEAFDRPIIIDTSILAADGKTRLYGKLILPTHFIPTNKYPVIVYLYNGPHVQLIKNGFPESGNLWYEYMAQHGYVVWTMDGRGSSNRGLAFEQAVFRRLGTFEMEDQLKGVDFLKSLPYVDPTRMGVHGWSFGGFMTTSLMLRHPGVFKCAVAGGPVMDWSMYEIMYGERYMDTPEQNPEGYKESALYDKVQNLTGKLLLIHGTQDATVVWQHSIKFLKAAVDKNVQLDYFVYPGYEHNVRGKDRAHLMQKISQYFDQNL